MECVWIACLRKKKSLSSICLPAIGLGRPSSIVSMGVYVKPECDETRS